MAVAALTVVVGGIALRETHGTRIWDEVNVQLARRES
jgi:hypothetical protein